MEDIIYNLWFHNININRKLKLLFLEEGISPYEFYNMKLKDYINYGLDIDKSQTVENSKELSLYYKTIDFLNKEITKYIFYTDQDYPKVLKNIYDPPIGLFLKGELPNLENSLAVVGSRKATSYGKTVAYKLSHELSAIGITIISGMALGIDSCAHQGALDSNSKTIAVIGSGFKYIYPSMNKLLAKEIANCGCIITEYMPDVKPFSSNFPERNRIISGLAKYTLIVEAGEKSGSLITARLALEQGKDVFAVPGNIFNINSIGTNNLIKDGAKLITSINDILEEYNLNTSLKNLTAETNEESLIISLLKKGGGMTIDDILINCNIDTELILSALSLLECKGIIKHSYGNFYILNS